MGDEAVAEMLDLVTRRRLEVCDMLGSELTESELLDDRRRGRA